MGALSHPSTGVYCVTPKPKSLDPAKHPAFVVPEWGLSSGFDLLAFWNQDVPADGCLVGDYQVRTYKNFVSGPTLNDSVAFVIVIF